MIGSAQNGLLPGAHHRIEPTRQGPLSRLTFVVKDLIDVAGHPTGGGNPDWLGQALPAKTHAAAVQQLLDSGAAIIGKAVTDELAFSLEGENLHYGTPVNPRNAAWLPGGSSSGSAVAVASGAADFALGTDTGGSVRVPAAFCGIFGFRPSHGALSLDGVLPFAPAYDTVGWFAGSAAVLAAVGEALLPPAPVIPIRRIALAGDVLAQVGPEIADDIRAAAAGLVTEAPVDVLGGLSLEEIADVYAIAQGYEIGIALGEQLSARAPRFAPSIAERFAGALATSKAAFDAADAARKRFARVMSACCAPDMAIALPVASMRHLSIKSPPSTRNAFYAKTLGLTAIAGHSGMPQVQFSVRAGSERLGLSLIGAGGADRALLALAVSLSGAGA